MTPYFFDYYENVFTKYFGRVVLTVPKIVVYYSRKVVGTL